MSTIQENIEDIEIFIRELKECLKADDLDHALVKADVMCGLADEVYSLIAEAAR